MSTFNKFNVLARDALNKVHDFFGTDDTFKVMLTNTAPNAATHAVKADITEISAGNGYTAGGYDIQNDSTLVSGVVVVTAVDVTITASGGAIGPFRWAVVYNDTPSSPLKPLIGYYDYGAAMTLQDGESIKVDFQASFLNIG